MTSLRHILKLIFKSYQNSQQFSSVVYCNNSCYNPDGRILVMTWWVDSFIVDDIAAISNSQNDLQEIS